MEEKFPDYLKFVRDARSYNNQLADERKLRMPFIDTQTGIAQNECSLWRSKCERKLVAGGSNSSNSNSNSNSRGQDSNGIIYSYPASKWCKRRREYLMKPNNHSASLATANGHHQTQNSQQFEDQFVDTYRKFKHESTSSSSDVGVGQVKINNNGGASLPSSSSSSLVGQYRADSTGSHSCNTADSDSRDHSVATSQSSFDSPKDHNIPDDDPSMDCSHKFEVQLNLSNPINGLASGNDRIINSVNSTNGNDESNSLQLRNFEHHSHLEDQTKAAIKLHSKLIKKKNIGQSLINKNGNNSNSILVKDINQRKTGIDNMIYDHARSHLDQDSIHLVNINGQRSSPELALCVGGDPGRPYVCSLCDQTYKTRPGLSYHFLHTHNATLPKSLPTVRKREPKRMSPSATSNQLNKHKTSTNSHESSQIPEQPTETTEALHNHKTHSDGSHLTELQHEQQNKTTSSGEHEQSSDIMDMDNHVDCGPQINGQSELSVPTNKVETNATNSTPRRLDTQHEDLMADETQKREPNGFGGTSTSKQEVYHKKVSPKMKQNPFCDFCLGTVEKNRRTRLPEQLVSCSRCGSSGHPSCLRFSDNIIISIRKYDWQCIECKTCSTCNNADNEHQLLFCDDCDRSYHTYCLRPPLAELPEGNWSCLSCQKEYHNNEIQDPTKT